MAIVNKRELINIILESISDVDEMARRPCKTQAPARDPVTGEYIVRKWESVWHPDNPTPPCGDGTPDGYVIKQNGITRLVIPVGCKQIHEFAEEHKEWLKSIGAYYRLEPELFHCVSKVNKTGMWKYHPRNLELKTQYIPTGEHYDAEEIIKRTLYAMIQDILASDDVSKKLESCSIPTIKARKVAHLDRHGTINNDVVKYGTHTFNAYKNTDEFLKFVVARMGGHVLEDEFKEYHLARQYNQNYSNWKETKKQDPEYSGKTEAYMLEKFGLSEENTNLVVRTDLNIEGTRKENTFEWVLYFTVKFGSKLEESIRMKKSLDINKNIELVREVEYKKDKPFTDGKERYKNHTIMHDDAIRTAIVSMLYELREIIMSSEFDPIYMMEKI